MRTRIFAVVGTAFALAVSGLGTTAVAAPTVPPLLGCEVVPPTVAQQTVLAEWHHDLGTGEQGSIPDPIGAADTKWSTVAPVPGPAYSVTPNAAWVTSPEANWINSGRPGGPFVGLDDVLRPADDLLSPFVPVGLLPTVTRFRTTFDLPALSVGRALVFDFAADNGVTFYLNGTPVGGFDPTYPTPPAFNVWHPLVYAGPAFHDGTNVLDAVVTDYGVATGFILDGGVRACVGTAKAGMCLAVRSSSFVPYPATPVDITTAAGVPFGTADTRWTTTTGPAFSVAPHASWITTSGANWVNDTPTRSSGAVFGVTTRTFQVTFDLGHGTAYRDLDFRYASDNGVAFTLNGVPVGGFYNGEIAAAFNQFRSLNWAGAGFVDGVNVLQATVTDHGGSRGLLVQGAAHTCNPLA